MAVPPRHPDAIRELRPVSRARFFPAGERLELHIFIAGIFSETPQAGVLEGGWLEHAGERVRAGRSADEGGQHDTQ